MNTFELEGMVQESRCLERGKGFIYPTKLLDEYNREITVWMDRSYPSGEVLYLRGHLRDTKTRHIKLQVTKVVRGGRPDKREATTSKKRGAGMPQVRRSWFKQWFLSTDEKNRSTGLKTA